jgi:hypothetical protein
MNAIVLAEKQDVSSNIVKEFPNRAMYSNDMFINIGTDDQPILIKTSCSSFIPEILSGKMSLQQFIEKGDAFTNVTNLFIDGEINRKVDYIANRVTTEFNNTSPEWKRWTNMTSQYNATSLSQAMYEFFDMTSDSNYSPKPDYPGTFAPGEYFIDQYQVNQLSRHILHPWPAMQELKFTCRWPPNHPVIFPPPLWIALNNMYTGNFSESLRREAGTMEGFEPTEAVGGNSMEAKDALRIADFANFGECYDLSQQLKHGGMAFDRGQKIPNYNPDHGGTVPPEESSLDDLIPEDLLKFKKRWLDPYFGMDSEVIQTTLSEELQDEADNEEAIRRAAAERLLNQMQSAKWEPAEQEMYRSIEVAKLENLADMAERAAKTKKELQTIIEEDDIDEEENVDPAIITKKVERAQRYAKDIAYLPQLLAGKARNFKRLISYTINVMDDTQADIFAAETDITVRRKSLKKRRKKVINADSPLYEDDAADISDTIDISDAAPAE